MPHLDPAEGSSWAQKVEGQEALGRGQNQEAQFVAAGYMIPPLSLPLANCPFSEAALGEYSFPAAGLHSDTSLEQLWAFCHIRCIAEAAPSYMPMWSFRVALKVEPDLCRSSPPHRGLLAH